MDAPLDPCADISAYIDDFARFISASPSSYHAAAEVGRQLAEAGFTRLDETEAWGAGDGRSASEGTAPSAGEAVPVGAAPGAGDAVPVGAEARNTAGRFFVIRDGAVVAWVVPEGAGPSSAFRILGAHTDSPGFKLKPKPTVASNGWLQAGVEVYGGPLLNSWLDRELELAGRLVTRDGRELLVRTGPFLRIPQLAIHLDRDANTGLTLDRQRHTTPVFGVGQLGQADLVDQLAGLAEDGLTGQDVAGYDILTADTAAPARFGLAGELFAGGRMDNLSSVYAGLVALVRSAGVVSAGPAMAGAAGTAGAGAPGGAASGAAGSAGAGAAAAVGSGAAGSAGAGAAGGAGSGAAGVVGAGVAGVVDSGAVAPHISVLAAFDHEELGSESRSGASGPLLDDILTRISSGLGASTEQRLRAYAASWCLSADAGHSVHPNYPEKHDPANRVIAGGGPLLKINANQRYATDAHGAALWAAACAQAGVAYQEFVSNNSVPCGSTIGPLTATRLGIRTVDVGVPLLSMHSARELCHVNDPVALAAAVTAFFAPRP